MYARTHISLDIDVLGGGDSDDDEVVVIDKPVVTKSQSLKRPGTVISHLEKIRAYEGECGAITTTTVEVEEEPPSKLLKRYKHDDQEELHEKIDRLAYHLRLEHELRILEANKNNRRFAKLEREAREKDQEIVRLRQQASLRNNNNNTTTTPRRVVKSKKSTATVEPALQQQQLDSFLTTPVTTLAIRNNNNNNATPPQRQQQQEAPKSAKQQAKEIEEAHKLALQQKFDAYNRELAQWYEQYDTPAHSTLRAYIECGEANIGISIAYPYLLSEYLQKFLEIAQADNQHIEDIIDHPFLANYRVQLMANMLPLDEQQQQQNAFVMLKSKRDVLNRESVAVRYNLSNVMIHTNFIAKAIKFTNETTLGYRPVILQNFQYGYAPEILAKWYPRLDAGNGYVITPDLKITAVCTLHGQGRGKRCCFCGLEYIACNGGVLKHTHQVTGCDYLANASDDERVVLNIVLERRAIYVKFAKHKFIANYDSTSLLRLATPDEIERGLYVTYAKTGEHLRLNMPVFLALRKEVYEEFLSRIDSLDTHTDNKNLDAKPFAHQLDCFGHSRTNNVAVTAVASAPKKVSSKQNKKKKNARHDDTSKIHKEQGFLYKTLLDHDGGQFRKTKFDKDGRTSLRNFAVDPLTGFGDDMYFSAAPEIAPRLYNNEETDNLNRRVAEEMAHTDAQLLQEAQQQQRAIVPAHQQQQQQQEEDHIRIDFSNTQNVPQQQQQISIDFSDGQLLPQTPQHQVQFAPSFDWFQNEQQQQQQQMFNNYGFGNDEYEEQDEESLYRSYIAARDAEDRFCGI